MKGKQDEGGSDRIKGEVKSDSGGGGEERGE